MNDDDLFYDIVGGHDRKRRLYGFGSYGKVIPSSNGSKETCYIMDMNADKELAHSKAEMDEMKEIVNTQNEELAHSKVEMDEMKEVVNTQKEEIEALKKLVKTQGEDHKTQLALLFSSLKDMQK